MTQWYDNWKEKIDAELDGNVLPFWLDQIVDVDHGGYLHQLDRHGRPISPHKGMWVHGRLVWLLSWLYQTRRRDQRFLDVARTGWSFIQQYGRDRDGRWWYQVLRDGTPLQKRRYLFTEVFITLGLSAYAAVQPSKETQRLSEQAYTDLHYWLENSHSLNPKYQPSAWHVKGHSMTMILVNLYQELRRIAPDREAARNFTDLISHRIDELFQFFVKPEHGALLELVADDGTIIDTPEGREINPGHAIETAWFLLDEAEYRHDIGLRDEALRILDWSLARGWDKEYGGLLSFCDLQEHPSHHIEATMKYWWPHTEALYATLAAYTATGLESYKTWFESVATYTFDRFPDPAGPEWFGYLYRDGSVANPVKGNLWKGPFHIPRALHKCSMLLAHNDVSLG